jgi:hypothetical protein
MNTMRIAAGMLAVLALGAGGHALEIKGVQLPDRLQAGDSELVLNGGGVRSRYMMDLYVAGLYLPARDADGARIVAADEPMAIRLQIISSLITSDRMEEATREGFENATGGNTAPIRDEIEQFIEVFRTEIKVGDVYDLVYVPGTGVEVFKNGNRESVTPGLALKRALFGIWLGEKPAQKNLKNGLLGN